MGKIITNFQVYDFLIKKIIQSYRYVLLEHKI